MRGERAGLSRLVSNLVSNAVLYTAPETMVEVRVGTRDGRASSSRSPTGARASRRPTAGRIFERFVRLDGRAASNPQGSGLGLAIVEQVVEAHGGRIEVRENEGGGTIFMASFPAV